ncbi:MAG: DUF1232 domain-containing protein [Chloroflexi bacterium]|nr:DUF1232 domain-containing protein [Chloroflexota bacterium]
MTIPTPNRRSPHFWVGVFNSFRLTWRLLRDQQVPIAAKLVPLGVLAYILFPIDFLPDAILGLGQVDDLALLLLGIQVFIAIVPRALVQRHRDAMDGVAPKPGTSQASKEIIDG